MLTVKTALEKEFPGKVTVAANASELKSKSADASAIVVAVGEMPYAEGFGSIQDITLPDDQMELIKAAQDTGKPVILVDHRRATTCYYKSIWWLQGCTFRWTSRLRRRTSNC